MMTDKEDLERFEMEGGPVLPELDEPPSRGKWVDEHTELSDEDAQRGNALGEAIAIDDDDDNGLDLQ
jgi:hypothetical protein